MELLTGRRRDAMELELQARDGGGRWSPLEAREKQSLDGVTVRGRFGQALLDGDSGLRARRRKRKVQLESEARGRGSHAPREKLIGKGRGEPVQDEAERLEILDGRLDRQ